jgi:hypothetical protein
MKQTLHNTVASEFSEKCYTIEWDPHSTHTYYSIYTSSKTSIEVDVSWFEEDG